MSGKLAVKHKGEEIEAMAAMARAAKQKSLEDFTASVREIDYVLDWI